MQVVFNWLLISGVCKIVWQMAGSNSDTAKEILKKAAVHEAYTEDFRQFIIQTMVDQDLSYDRAGKLTNYSSAIFHKVKNGGNVKDETLRQLAVALAEKVG